MMMSIVVFDALASLQLCAWLHLGLVSRFLDIGQLAGSRFGVVLARESLFLRLRWSAILGTPRVVASLPLFLVKQTKWCRVYEARSWQP